MPKLNFGKKIINFDKVIAEILTCKVGQFTLQL